MIPDPLKVLIIFVTLPTSHVEMSPLNSVFLRNIPDIVVAADVSQNKSELNVKYVGGSWVNFLASQTWEKFATRLTFHKHIGP
jgi:hypothetical protein